MTMPRLDVFYCVNDETHNFVDLSEEYVSLNIVIQAACSVN